MGAPLIAVFFSSVNVYISKAFLKIKFNKIKTSKAWSFVF